MNELIEIFNNCSIEDNLIFPPKREDMEIDEKLYPKFKKLLTQNLGKWRAGRVQAFEFPFNPSSLLEKLRNGETPNYKQEWHYFPTPLAVVEQMFNICIPEGQMRCLEPSAGRGSIIEYIDEMGGYMADITWDAVELEPTNRRILQEKGINLVGDDFDNFETDVEYDIIYANPPFKKDLKHVTKILDILQANGCAVIVLPANFEDKYKKQVEEWKGDFEHIGFYKVPAKAFKESGTSIDTVIMYAAYKKRLDK